MIFKVTYRGSTVVSPDLEEEVILSWRTLRKLGVIHGLFPRPHPWAERVVKAIADKVVLELVPGVAGGAAGSSCAPGRKSR